MSEPRRRPGLALAPVLAAVIPASILAASCSNDTGSSAADGTGDGPAGLSPDATAATVRGTEITVGEVQDLAADPGFRAYLKAPVPEGDLQSSELGRATLGWLIDAALLRAELERRGVAVTQADLDEAAGRIDSAGDALSDDSGPVDKGPDAATGVEHEKAEPSGDVRTVLVGALASYLALDAHLRSLEAADEEQLAYLAQHYPTALEETCGFATFVAPADAERATELVGSGTRLEDLAAQVEVLASTAPGVQTCVTGAEATSQIAELMDEVPAGSIGIQDATLPAVGVPGRVFARVDMRREAPEESRPAERALAELIRQGATTHAALEKRETTPDVSPDWGIWSPSSGVVPADAEEPYDLVEPAVAVEPPPVAEYDPVLSPILDVVPDPGPADPLGRAEVALSSAVTGPWLEALPVSLSLISGGSSLSSTDGSIQVASYHASGPWNRLQAIMAHEFGHHVAFGYGDQSELGAAPAGWPPSGSPPVERWADCVAHVFTGNELASHGQTPCEGDSLGFTEEYLREDPAELPRTG